MGTTKRTLHDSFIIAGGDQAVNAKAGRKESFVIRAVKRYNACLDVFEIPSLSRSVKTVSLIGLA